MKILTLRDNTKRYQPLGDVWTDIGSSLPVVGSAISLLSNLFGGDNAGGYVNGRFVPGDINNRLQFFAQRLTQYGLSVSDIDQATVDSFIYQPSGWQGNIDRYVLEVYQDKTANPGKYKKTIANIFNGTGAGVTSSLGGMNITTILLVGAAVYFGAQMLGSKKRGRR
jgi:hypothetical protein